MHKNRTSNILFFSYGEFIPNIGGIANYVNSFINVISSNFKVTVIASPISKANKHHETQIKIIRPHLFTKIASIYAKTYFLIKAVILKPKYIFISDQQSFIYAQYILKLRSILFFKPKICLFLYGTDILDMGLSCKSLSLYYAKQLRQIDHCICISQYTKNLLIKHFPFLTKKKVSLCYPTISQEFKDVNFTKGDVDDFLNKLQLHKQQYFVSVGRLVKRKGHEQVIKILPQILSKYPNLKYLIIGDGEQASYLEQLAKELKVKNSVIIKSLSEIEKKIALKNALFLIHPSHDSNEPGQRVEGFGIVILEALTIGIPVVATNNGGISEIVTNNVNGYLVKSSDSKGLLSACQKILINRNRQKMANQTIKSVKQFLGKNYSDQIKSLMSKLRQKNIAYIVEWFYPIVGGAGKQALLLANFLPKFNIYFYTKLIPETPKIDTRQGFPVQRLGPTVKSMSKTQSRFFDYFSAWQLFKQLFYHSSQIDLIHIHGNLTNNFSAAAILAAKLFRIPIIVKPALYGEFSGTGHLTRNIFVKNLSRYNPFNWLRLFIAKRADCYLAISQDIIRELQTNKINGHKIIYLPNGIEVKKLIKKQENNKIINCLAVSRFSHNKGLIFPLLQTWNLYFKNNHQLRLTIIGGGQGLSGSNETEVNSFIKNNHMQNVKVLSLQKNLDLFYKHADIFIQPSQNEGLSNALLEAASFGLIIIASKVSGNIDLINSKTGFLFDSKNSESLYQTLNLVFKKHHAWANYQNNLLLALNKNYNIVHIANKLQALYEKMAI